MITSLQVLTIALHCPFYDYDTWLLMITS